MKIGIAIQRYGADITGGSEHLCRMIAERLASRHEVEVLTSCAKDYISWKNEYPEGRTLLNGVTVSRFASKRTRDLDSFNRFSEQIYYNDHTTDDEMKWLEDQGPFCPGLVEFLQARSGDYDRLIFFTYLYYPTYHGLQIAPEKSVLVPTAHDEPAIRLSIFKQVFSAPYALIYNTEAEKRFVNILFSPTQLQQVGGVGVDLPLYVNRRSFRRRHGLIEDYFYYGGRIDAGKGCAELIDFYLRKKSKYADLPLLILSGHLSMDLPADPSIVYVGYLSDAEKTEAIQGATLVIVPSVMESLSLLLLESFASRTPALVKEGSEVLKDHCIRSNAGLFYSDFDEFSACLDYLMERPGLRHRLGIEGQKYIQQYYSWPRVISTYEQVLTGNMNLKENATV